MVDERLIDLLQRMQQAMSFRQIAKAAGIGSAETLARVWRREGKLGAESARKLALTYGEEWHFTENDLREWSGLSPRQLGHTNRTSVPITSAPPYYSTFLPTSPVDRKTGLAPSPWVGLQSVPFVLQRIHGGRPTPDYNDPPTLPANVPHPGRYLAMRVVGECMMPAIEPGDIVILDQEMPVTTNWVAAIQVDGDSLLMRVVRRDPDEWEFAPDNEAMDELIVPANGIEVIGMVIARQKGPPVGPSPRRLKRLTG